MKLRWLNHVRVIGWDLDGTLYPANDDLSKKIKELRYVSVAEKNNWSMDKARQEFDRLHGEMGSSTKALYELGIDGIGFYTDVWDKMDLSKFIKTDEKIKKMIDSLNHKGLIQFMVSNSNRLDQIERKLGLIGLSTDEFDLVVSTVELGVVKPDPEPFLFALEKLDMEPEEVLFVGDRVATDVLGARGVGMNTCLVGGVSKDADVSLESVYEVESLFGGENE